MSSSSTASSTSTVSTASTVSSATPVAGPTLAASAVIPWLVFAGLLVLLALYFVSAEQGAASMLSGTAVHEWVHDGRHLLGFPCH